MSKESTHIEDMSKKEEKLIISLADDSTQSMLAPSPFAPKMHQISKKGLMNYIRELPNSYRFLCHTYRDKGYRMIECFDSEDYKK